MKIYTDLKGAETAHARRVQDTRRSSRPKSIAILSSPQGYVVAVVYDTIQAAIAAADYWSMKRKAARAVIQLDDDTFVVMSDKDKQRIWPFRQSACTVLYPR